MATKKILIVGGGFAGVFAAKTLKKSLGNKANIELINNDNYFVFQPLLPEVAAGSITASDAISPLRALLKGVQIRVAEVIDIDFDAQKLTVLQGTRRLPIDVDYDHLILAMGQSADLSRFPGLSEHALTMKNMSDAFRLRNHIIGCLENADVTPIPEIKKQLLNFCVVGAGFSGVETVGEVKELIDKSLKYFPNIAPEDVHVKLIEFADRILLELPESLATYAQKQLEKHGVEVMTGVGVKSATGTSALLTNDNVVETRTIVATIGTGPHKLVEKLRLPMHWGKIKAERTMLVEGFENVWAIGDAALLPLVEEPKERYDYAPPTAQFAVREGKQLAKNMIRKFADKDLKPFAHESQGALASIGASSAVAELMILGKSVRLRGWFAFFVWRSFYVTLLPGFAAKFRVCANWFFNTFITRNIVQIQAPQKPATRYLHYRKGDKVFDRGMVADGFYTVIKGGFQLLLDDESGKTTKRTYGPGDHFGERIILGRSSRSGRVEATEDSVVLWVARGDFERFAKGFPMLDQYFQDYIREKFGKEALAEKEPEKSA